MKTIINTAILVLLWCVNIFNGTGLDSVYHVTQNTKTVVLIASIACFLIKNANGNRLLVQKNDFFTFGVMSCSFCISVYMGGYGFQAIDYLWVFCLIYLISYLSLDETAFWLTGIICGIGGLFILYIYSNSSVLSGWNDNSIAMIGMDSFLLMLISLCFVRSFFKKGVLLLLSAAYIVLILPTDSRSGILFVLIGVLFALNIISKKILCGGKGRITVFLLIPLIVALFVILISNTEAFTKLEIWSYRQFQKPIFNGRDYIWKSGLEVLFSNFFLGAGTITRDGWHNSAITCLATYGCIGYVFWIMSFRNIIIRSFEWMYDKIVQGCLLSFFLLYFQQSVELGLIGSRPSVTAYLILGMMLGRIRYLWMNEVYEFADN